MNIRIRQHGVLASECWHERLNDPPPKGGSRSLYDQRQGWKTPRGPSGSALLLCM